MATIDFHASGDVSDYSPGDRQAVAQAFADRTGLPASRIHVSVRGASVIISVTLDLAGANPGTLASVMPLLTSAAAANAFLSRYTPVVVDAMPVIVTNYTAYHTTPDPGSGSGSGGPIFVILAAIVGVCMLCAGTAFFGQRLKNKRRQRLLDGHRRNATTGGVEVVSSPLQSCEMFGQTIGTAPLMLSPIGAGHTVSSTSRSDNPAHIANPV
jgi:hypothetical protein